MQGCLNIGGLVLNIVGTFLVAIYGMPNLKRLSSGAYSEIEETPEIVKSQRLATAGLWLLFSGFVAQLLAILCG